MFVDVWLTNAPLFGALLTRKSWCQATLSSNVLAVHFARELRAIFASELRAIARKERQRKEDDRRQEEEEREELEYNISEYESDIEDQRGP